MEAHAIVWTSHSRRHGFFESIPSGLSNPFHELGNALQTGQILMDRGSSMSY